MYTVRWPEATCSTTKALAYSRKWSPLPVWSSIPMPMKPTCVTGPVTWGKRSEEPKKVNVRCRSISHRRFLPRL